mgnify:CR=1 FL=1
MKDYIGPTPFAQLTNLVFTLRPHWDPDYEAEQEKKQKERVARAQESIYKRWEEREKKPLEQYP